MWNKFYNYCANTNCAIYVYSYKKLRFSDINWYTGIVYPHCHQTLTDFLDKISTNVLYCGAIVFFHIFDSISKTHTLHSTLFHWIKTFYLKSRTCVIEWTSIHWIPTLNLQNVVAVDCCLRFFERFEIDIKF